MEIEFYELEDLDHSLLSFLHVCVLFFIFLNEILKRSFPFGSIYKVHDEAKDKAFELEMSWICDESKRQHEKVILHPSSLNGLTPSYIW